MSFEIERARMVDQLRAFGISDLRVLEAFRRVPREEFVPEEARGLAYADMPLPIGSNQTISQPYVVALTIEAMRLDGTEHVLEIGTGSGYAAALLGMIAREVETVERLPELAASAAERLVRLGFDNVHVHTGDGSLGWPEGAPYQAICVAAAAPRPPPALLDQLAIGGRLVIPHGSPMSQQLACIHRRDQFSYDETDLGAVRFVPLVGAEGWPTPRD